MLFQGSAWKIGPFAVPRLLGARRDGPGVRERQPGDAHGLAVDDTTLVPVHPHAGGHKRVDVRATSVAVAPSVAGDRAQDEARVGHGQGGMVETLALDHDVDAVGQRADLVVVGDDAALAPLPDRSTPDRPVVTALDGDDVGAVVGQEHAGHRSGDT